MFRETVEYLDLLGIDTERIELAWISSAEGIKFARAAEAFTEKIKELGPANLRAEAGQREEEVDCDT